MSNDLFQFPGGKDPKFAKDKHPLRSQAELKEIIAWLRDSSPKAGASLKAVDDEMAATVGAYEFVWIGRLPPTWRKWAKVQFGTSVANKDHLNLGQFSRYHGYQALRLTKSQGQIGKLKRLDRKEFDLVHDPDGQAWGTLLQLKTCVVGNRTALHHTHVSTLESHAERLIRHMFDTGS